MTSKPKAFVVLSEGFAASIELERELKEYVKTTLAAFKYPRWIEVRSLRLVPIFGITTKHQL